MPSSVQHSSCVRKSPTKTLWKVGAVSSEPGFIFDNVVCCGLCCMEVCNFRSPEWNYSNDCQQLT